jgi:hypothetical protein
MAQDALNYFLSHQGSDGGFSYAVAGGCAWCDGSSDSNDTAAAIIALFAAGKMNLSNINIVGGRDNAVIYLLTTQQSDGGFSYDSISGYGSDAGSTAWALMALNMVGDPVRVQALAARSWLLSNQGADGGFHSYTTSQTTSDAIVALLGTTWLLQPSPLHVSSPAPSSPLAQSTATPAKQATVPSVVLASAKTASTVSASPNEVLGSAATDETHAGVVTDTPSQTTASATTTAHTAKNHRAVYGALTLLLIALGWFVVQSRHSKAGV